ncbi:hypothetical protein [Thermaurantiacus tibetensis]|uniref:hypothetical protein n=1 Tax=Thermaurantiacus tibetensis TaxID=2759035 RepID=UPI00188FFC9B|nr:hypothetical protein [Thermaurantiacus tibetensis]
MRQFVPSALRVVAAVAATLAGAPAPAAPEAGPRAPRAERPVTATPEYARAMELRNRGRWAEGAAILDDLARKTADPRERMQLALFAAQLRVSQNEHDSSRLALRPGTLPPGYVEATRQLAEAIAAADPALGPEVYAIAAARLGERLAVEDRTQQTLGRKAEVLAAFDGAIAAGQGSDLPPQSPKTWAGIRLAEGDSVGYYGFRDPNPALLQRAAAAYRAVEAALGAAGARALDPAFPLKLGAVLGGLEERTGDVDALDQAVGLYREALKDVSRSREDPEHPLLVAFRSPPPPEDPAGLARVAAAARDCAPPRQPETCAILALRAADAHSKQAQRTEDPAMRAEAGALAELGGTRFDALGSRDLAARLRASTGRDLVHHAAPPDPASTAIAIRLLQAALAREAAIPDATERADTWEALAVALRRRGEWGEGMADFEASRAAIARALKTHTRSRDPHMWAHAETRRIETEIAIAERSGNTRLLADAERDLAEARRACVASGCADCAKAADAVATRLAAARARLGGS